MIMSVYGLLWPLLEGLLQIFISPMSLTSDPVFTQIFILFAALSFPLRGIYFMIVAKWRGNKISASTIIITLIEICLSVAIILLPQISYTAFVIFFELYLTAYISMKIIDSCIFYKNKVKRYLIPSICQAIFFAALFFTIIFVPDDFRKRLVFIGVGIALWLFGVAHICDFVSQVTKNEKLHRILSSIRLTLPDFIGMCIPHRFVNAHMSDIKVHDDSPINAEVLFHFAHSGLGVAGHCELCIDGRTYTYGNYDPESRTVLSGAGNGIIISAEREPYLDYVINKTNKVILSYGLHLDDKQLDALRKKLQEFDSILEDWTDVAAGLDPSEYARRIHDAIGCKFYKIKNGEFRTYFTPSINCVQLTDYFLRDTNIGRIIIPGLHTPGAYLDMFNRLYTAGDRCVASINIFETKKKGKRQRMGRGKEMKA